LFLNVDAKKCDSHFKRVSIKELRSQLKGKRVSKKVETLRELISNRIIGKLQ
jgi:hypothetical protein